MSKSHVSSASSTGDSVARVGDFPAGSLAARLVELGVPFELAEQVSIVEFDARLAADVRRSVVRLLVGHLAGPVDGTGDADVIRLVAEFLRTFGA